MAVSTQLNLILQQNEQNKLAHAFLIETNNIIECNNELTKIIKVINCPHQFKDQCQEKCRLCQLIDKNSMPSIITINPDGMQIKRQQVAELEEKFSYKPIYSKYNVYILNEADKLNLVAANIILKFLEEPTANIIGFLVTKNSNAIIPTIKSRCEIIQANYDITENIDNNLAIITDKYLEDIFNTRDYLINRNDILNVYTERADVQKILQLILTKYLKMVGNNLHEQEKNLKILTIIQKALNFIQYNVNLELALDNFVIEMRKVNE
jgi:DNA polymerase III delta prime subunit